MPATNAEIAKAFEEVAELLATRGAGFFRVRAYREGAESLQQLDREVADIWKEGGHSALVALPRIGERLATAVEDMLANGHFHLLDRLRGEGGPIDLFTTLPGVGPKLADRIHRELGVESLEELELAAHDGSLARVSGLGPRRAAAIRDILATILRRSTRRRARLIGRSGEVSGRDAETMNAPSIAALLAIDTEYRTRAEAGTLPRITPRRFNPKRERWLPILHAQADGWEFDALYSNTARAHELGHTRDWVVVFYSRNGDEGQCTVVTEYRGPMRGLRVIRGREPECIAHYGLRGSERS